MGLFDCFTGKSDGNGSWSNCCRAPPSLAITPSLPPDYTAWIHRCGWVMYVHEPTKTPSWLHPGILAEFEAKGMKGPGFYGPEMWIYARNVNRGGHYCVDYGYPPMGQIRHSLAPGPMDFDLMDRIGYEAWKKWRIAKSRAEAAVYKAAKKEAALRDGPNAHVGVNDNLDSFVPVQEGKEGKERKKGKETKSGTEHTGMRSRWEDPEWAAKWRETREKVMREQGVWELWKSEEPSSSSSEEEDNDDEAVDKKDDD